MLHELEEERSSRRLEAYFVVYFFFFWDVVVGGRMVRYVTSLAIWNGIEGIQVPNLFMLLRPLAFQILRTSERSRRKLLCPQAIRPRRKCTTAGSLTSHRRSTRGRPPQVPSPQPTDSCLTLGQLRSRSIRVVDTYRFHFAGGCG